MKLMCECCGEVKELQFDGYHFGDRLLEGVMFIASVEDGKLAVRFKEPHDPYLKRLNKKEILEEALEFAEGNDIFQCCDCGEDSWIDTGEPIPPAQEGTIGVAVPVTNIMDFMQGLTKEEGT